MSAPTPPVRMPAFPSPRTLAEGMDLRDYFAGCYIQSFGHTAMSALGGKDAESTAIYMADYAYRVADIMMERRRH